VLLQTNNTARYQNTRTPQNYTTLHQTTPVYTKLHHPIPNYSPDFPTPPCPRTITLRGFWREHKLILQKEDLGEEDVVISWGWWWGFCWLDKILWSTEMLGCCCHHVTSRSALISLPATRYRRQNPCCEMKTSCWIIYVTECFHSYRATLGCNLTDPFHILTYFTRGHFNIILTFTPVSLEVVLWV